MFVYGLLLSGIGSCLELYMVFNPFVAAVGVFCVVIISRSAMGRADAGGMTLDPNESALLISLTIPFLYHQFRRCRGIAKLYSLACIIVGICAIFATGSRGSVIALICSLLYSFFVTDKKFFKRFLQSLAVVFIVVLLLPSGVKQRFIGLGDESDYNITFKHGRVMVWERALSIIEENPVLGIGLNTFSYAPSSVNNESRGCNA